MALFDCFRSKRAKEINSFVKEKRYDLLLRQCGYDEISSFTQLWTILSGPKEKYDGLCRIIAQDPTMADVILPYFGANPSLAAKTKMELFSIGVQAEARETGENAVKHALTEQGFTQPEVLKEIVACRYEEVLAKGLEAIAGRFAEERRVKDVRDNYVRRMTGELDARIEGTQAEALDAVKDQIASTDNYLALLMEKRDELNRPYEERKLRLDDEFNADHSTAREHIKAKQLFKAYELFTKLGHDLIVYESRGLKEVKQNRTPSWLFDEIIKQANLGGSPLEWFAAQAFYCAHDQKLAVLVTFKGKAYIRKECVPRPELTIMLGQTIHDVQCWANRNSHVYVEIDETKRRPEAIANLIEEALALSHRE